jgi:Spy/CpxP family protein refolding chaperone
MKSSNWLLVTVAATLTCSGLAFSNCKAAESDTAQRPGRQHWLKQAKEALGLTEEQSDKIKSVLRAEKDVLKDLISGLHQARTALRQTIQAPDANETSVRSASAKVAAIEADLAVERLKIFERIRPVLSNDQLEKLKELRDRMDESVEYAIDRIGKRLSSE